VIDADGHPLALTIGRANWNDQRNLLATIESIRIGKRCFWPNRLGLDKGYDSEPLRRELRKRRITPNAPYRKNHVSIPLGRSPKAKREKRYNRQRWKVERSFAWVNHNRRLGQMFEESQRAYRALYARIHHQILLEPNVLAYFKSFEMTSERHFNGCFYRRSFTVVLL